MSYVTSLGSVHRRDNVIGSDTGIRTRDSNPYLLLSGAGILNISASGTLDAIPQSTPTYLYGTY